MNRPPRRWESIARPDQAARIQEAVEAIRNDLLSRPLAIPRDSLEAAGARSSFLSGALIYGWAGVALFCHYHDAKRNPGAPSADAGALLERAFAAVADSPPWFALYHGITGIGWVAQFLAAENGDADAFDLSELDDAVLRVLRNPDLPGEFDLFSGLIGLGLYGLERCPEPAGREIVNRAVERLRLCGSLSEDGVTWLTPPDAHDSLMRKIYPDGCFNLGMAHGIPGAIAFLAGAARAGNDAAPELLQQAARWLLARRLQQPNPLFFPPTMQPDLRSERLSASASWCYGDLGIACSLVLAAPVLPAAGFLETAIELGKNAASRPLTDFQTRDACLCHGAAGNAHLFQRLYQFTGEAEFREASGRWLDLALAQRRPGEGIGGYRFSVASLQRPREYQDESGFLSGSAGVGLALLAAASDRDPAWDRVLLLSHRW